MSATVSGSSYFPAVFPILFGFPDHILQGKIPRRKVKSVRTGVSHKCGVVPA